MSELERLQKDRADYEARLKKNGKRLLKEELQSIFEAVPELETLSWRQYTPSFNDGSPCVFQVYGFDATFNVAVLGEEPGYEFSEVAYHDGDPVIDRTRKAIKTLEKLAADMDDIFAASFDDGCTVTAKRNGTFETEEYYE